MKSLTTRDLSAGQRGLVKIMSQHQFGRIENLSVRAGQPVLDCDLKVVRVAKMGSENSRSKISTDDDYELKREFCDLFDELKRLGDGVVVRLEFRHGLPALLETSVPV